MIDPAEITRMIERFERICAELREVRNLIEEDPSHDHLQKAVQKLTDLLFQDGEIQDLEIEDLQARVARIEDSLGLSPEPPSSGGAARRVRLE